MKKLKQRLIELTEINKQHKALSPKGIEALIGDPTNADDLRLKLLRPINEALDPIFVKPPDYKRFSSELENFNNTQSILEEIDDPTFLKIYILNDILKMRDSTRNKSKYFSYEVKNEYQNKERVGVVTWSQLEDSPGREDAERFKKANSRKLTKLWSDYTKANEVTLEFMLKNFGYAMGGVVDMRNGGTVGAAVVAASLMASGGQAMDMRNGGRVGMVHGGPVIDYATPEEKEFDKDYDAVKQMETLLAKRQAAVDYGGFEQPAPMPDAVPPVPREKPRTHIHGAAKELVMKHLSRFKTQDIEQALNNLNSFTEKVLQAESDGNWEAKELSGETTASGGFQFVKGSVEPALNRLERRMKRKMPWRDELLKHKDASKLTPEQQTLLFLGDILEKRVGAPGTGDKLISKILSGDKQGMYDAWYTMHHTIPTDPKLRIGAKWGKGMTVVPSLRLERIFGIKSR